MTKQMKGFALLSPEQRRKVARMGGRAAHAKGAAPQFKKGDEATRRAGSKGGLRKAELHPHVPKQKRERGWGLKVRSEDQRCDDASKGGKAAHAKGTAHEWTSSTAKQARARVGKRP